MSQMGHFRPINDVCAMSAFHPIATKLLQYGKRRDGPKRGRIWARQSNPH
jgi:hypothetical protein